MARSQNDKAIEEYVFDMMPKRVKTARERALFDLYYGPSGEGGGYVKNHRIVEDWWAEKGPFELVVDDAGNVSDKHEFDKWLREVGKERYDEEYDEAFAEAKDELGMAAVSDAESYAQDRAEKAAQAEVDVLQENSWLYEDRDVRRLILTREWT